jgi:hypothetical protein
MDTITIMSTEVGVPNITYTSAEILRMMEELKTCKERGNTLGDSNVALNKDITKIRNHVRDFFSEVEWEDGEQTVSKSDVNIMLEAIGSDKLTSTYGGSFTITGTFQVDAEDAEEAENKFIEGVDVRFYEGDISIDDTTTEDVSEDY